MINKNIEPADVTDCFYVEDVNGNISLFRQNIADDLDPASVDHYYRIVEEGTFYPIEPQEAEGKKLVGYFVSKDDANYICMYVENGKYVCDDTSGDLGWCPIDDVIKSIMDRV